VDVAIGIDVGGTKILGALVGDDGSELYEHRVTTPRGSLGADPGGRAVADLIEHLIAVAHEDNIDVAAVGIGVPEYVTPAGTISSREVLDCGAQDVASIGLPMSHILIDSDVRCAAWAEQQVGCGSKFGSFLFVSIGTGISHTLMIHGKPWVGARGEAIALGELQIDSSLALLPSAPLTVERQASGRAIQEALTRHPATERVDAESLSDQAGRIVGSALNAAVHMFDPAAVVLGGGLGLSVGAFSDAVQRRFEDLAARRPSPPPLLRSQLGSHGGVIGAGLRALRLSRQVET
jgi:glucokinase